MRTEKRLQGNEWRKHLISALSLGVTLLLRFAAGIVVYVVIAAVVIACVAGTIFLWLSDPFRILK